MSLTDTKKWLEDYVYTEGTVDRAYMRTAASLANKPWPEIMAALESSSVIDVKKDTATPWGGDVWVWKGGLRKV